MKSNLKFSFEFIPEGPVDFSQNNTCPLRDECTQLSSDYTPKFTKLLSVQTALNSTEVNNTFDKDDEFR